MKKSRFLASALAAALCLGWHGAAAQIPVEAFAGHERATFDQMFFKFLKKGDGQPSRFLFFSRQRATRDNRQSATANLPQFGFTEAISWNDRRLRGLAPVAVGQVLNRGTFLKGGIQFAKLSKNWTAFGWAVSELKEGPNVDLFAMARFSPKLVGKWRLFGQFESLNTLPTVEGNPFSFVQRARMGLKFGAWQFGAGADFSQTGRGAAYAKKDNLGGFLRHEF